MAEEWDLVVVDTVKGFWDAIHGLSRRGAYLRGEPVYIEGGANGQGWVAMQSSIDRVLPKLKPLAALGFLEVGSLALFQEHAIQVGLDLQEDTIDRIDKLLSVVQQHGGATRLLDWTSSAWVAAYWASWTEIKCDGVVWWFDGDDVRWTGGDWHVVEEGSLANWYDWGLEQSDDIRLCRPMYRDRRVLAQQGLFTIARNLGKPHGDLLAEQVGRKRRGGLLLKGVLKFELMRDLHRMNVRRETLWPDVVGVATAVTEAMRFGWFSSSARVIERGRRAGWDVLKDRPVDGLST